MSYDQYSPPQRFQILPPVVKNLLIINILFFAATWVLSNRGIDLADMLGLHYPGSEKFHPYQFITYMFMHGSIEHIFFNMFALWMFGNVLENFWGAKRFLIFYLVCGVGAALSHYTIFFFQSHALIGQINDFLAAPSIEVFNALPIKPLHAGEVSDELRELTKYLYSPLQPDQQLHAAINFAMQYKIDFLNAPTVIGASGAVFGILLAFGMMFPNTLLYIYFAIPIKAKYFVFFYGLTELVSGVLSRPGDNVAHFAHLGGMLFGFILIVYWKRKMKRY